MITRADMEAWFTDTPVVTIPESALPEGLTHPATRTLLSTTGLPMSLLDVVEFSPRIADGLKTIVEIYREAREDLPPGATPGLYQLGFAAAPFLCVEAHAGTVHQVDEERGTWRLATGLEPFVRILAALQQSMTDFEEHLDRDADGDREALRRDVLAAVRAHDPGAGSDAEAAWQVIAGDLAVRL